MFTVHEVIIEGLNYWIEKIISKISHVEEFGCNKDSVKFTFIWLAQLIKS